MMLRTEAGWFATDRLDDDVTLIWEHRVSTDVRCNIWHIRGRDRDLLIDTGLGLGSLRDEIALLAGRQVMAVASHGHFDHIGGHWEFEERAVHAAEAEILARPTLANTVAEGYVAASMFLDAVPAGFDAAAYAIRPAPATVFLQGGELLDLGDRQFEVLHLPGHSPGSIALWESARGILFSGDVVYDGELLDRLYHSNPPEYVESMERLKRLPVTVVHAGHYQSFGRDRLIALADDYIDGRRRIGCAANENRPPDA